jgi:hypothetical protein
MRENLFDLDLQRFAEGEDAGENEVVETAEPQEDETTEETEVETGEEETGNAEPEPQSPEVNAQFAAMRRRAEAEAERKFSARQAHMDAQIAAMCKGITHPVTGRPITNMEEYVDALQIQQKQAREQELQAKGVDPSMIDRMIESNPTVMQAQRVLEQTKQREAEEALQRDLADISKYDPNIKGINDLAALPNFQEILDRVSRGANLVDAYKMVNFDNFMQHTNEAARQQAINQMRGKNHLATQSQNVATEDDIVEVPQEIMARYKEEGKTEKEVRELFKKVASKLNLN